MKTKVNNMNRAITRNKKTLFFFQKITRDNTKKKKRLTEIPVFTKRLTKRIFKKKIKVTQLFKPINY